MTHIFKAILGDWSNDGHGQTAINILSSNVSGAMFAKLYTEGLEHLGLTLEHCKEGYTPFCVEYEKNWISKQAMADALTILPKDLGAEFLCLFAEWQGKYHLEDSYLSVLIFAAKLLYPPLEISVVDMEEIEIGGYGLFS